MTQKETFLSKLKASKSFQKMKPEEQAELLRVYENATDEAYTAALKELVAAETDESRFEEIKKQKLEEQVVLAKEINQASKDLNRIVLQETEQKETASSDKVADALLKGIGADKDIKKRKKLFGLF